MALLTQVDFWLPGAGHRSRIATLVTALSRHVQLTVVWPTALDMQARLALSTHWRDVQVQALNLPLRGSTHHARAVLRAFFDACPQHACIFEYLSLGWLRRAVPPGVMTLVDTHDVVSLRDTELVALPQPLDRAVLSPAQEAAQLRTFDRVIAISQPDAAVFTGWVGAERVLLVPHPQVLRARPLRTVVRHLLFVGSSYAPNVDGLSWLLREVWPRLAARGLVLDVVGGVGPALRQAAESSAVQSTACSSAAGVRIHGVVADLEVFYDAADLVLNPVRHGSGLKIKSVEALSRGLPLVSTPHGVRGLENTEVAADPAYWVADTAEAFEAAVTALVADHTLRQRTSRAALRLAQREFSEQVCLAPLLAALGV